ncbi:hypothetical protein ABZ339_42200, partial [Streptomyces sp. NPDC005969]
RPTPCCPRSATASSCSASFVDTELSAWVTDPKISAADVAEQTMQALAHDLSEVLADDETKQAKAALSQPLERGPRA